MNEKTEALAKQAAEYAIEFATQDQAMYMSKLMEKFAELIVKECLVVINQPNGVGDNDVIRISRDVKKHFGVEE